MIMLHRFLLFSSALLLVSVHVTNAFQTALPRTSISKAPVVFTTTARHVVLSDAETEKIMKTAAECAEGECSIDDVSDLIEELQAQQKEMEKRLERIKTMVSELRHLNESGDERSDSEVRKFVRDLLRVFAHDDTKKIAKFTPSGFSGDIGSGSTTAYDALPPKKWKP